MNKFRALLFTYTNTIIWLILGIFAYICALLEVFVFRTSLEAEFLALFSMAIYPLIPIISYYYEKDEGLVE